LTANAVLPEAVGPMIASCLKGFMKE
jgi:hypothetical protein